MLILTRRVGETVVIGNDVDVTVLGVKGNQVRLGVKAPREVSVHREEIYKRIKDEKREEESNGATHAATSSSANGANGHSKRSGSAPRNAGRGNGSHGAGARHQGHHAPDHR